MTDILRLAHLSDPHQFFTMPRGTENLGKAGLGALKWRMSRGRHHGPEVAERLIRDLSEAAPDAVAMTGDLINFGLSREFSSARSWLSRLGPPERVIAVPGNHEALAPGWQNPMDEAWSGYVHGAGGAGFPFLRPIGPVALIAVSSAVATPPFLACGRVGAPARATLGRLIGKARAEGLCPVVAIHHPPTPITSWRKSLVDRRAVCNTLAEAGAALVLHGHTHYQDMSWIGTSAGSIPVLGVPCFSMRHGQRHPAGAWRMIQISGRPGSWTAQVEERAITMTGDVRARTPFCLRLPG